jgi:hypothetical protein
VLITESGEAKLVIMDGLSYEEKQGMFFRPEQGAIELSLDVVVRESAA